jgi:hypothetical protein
MSAKTAAGPQWIPLDFRKAVVAPGETPGALVLTVSGVTPRDAAGGAKIKLEPKSYQAIPEYWKIELLWDPSNANVPFVTPFTVSIPLETFRGTKGVEVVGQSRSQKISI